MRILFFGTPEFAKNVLSAIAASEYKNDIIGVVTREDKPKDRGHKLMPTPVKVLAQELGYPAKRFVRLRPTFVSSSHTAKSCRITCFLSQNTSR